MGNTCQKMKCTSSQMYPLPAEPQGKPKNTWWVGREGWVAFPFSRGSLQPRYWSGIELGSPALQTVFFFLNQLSYQGGPVEWKTHVKKRNAPLLKSFLQAKLNYFLLLVPSIIFTPWSLCPNVPSAISMLFVSSIYLHIYHRSHEGRGQRWRESPQFVF